MPKLPTIASLFGPSPFAPLQAHMRAAVSCAREVPPLFDALIAGQIDEVGRLKTLIFEKENQADRIKNELRLHLPRSLFMPVDRRDLLEVLRMQDSIADRAQDIAGLLVERQMTVPEPMSAPLVRLARRCVDACEQSLEIIEALDELVATGFRGREVDRVEIMVGELNDIEHETDELGEALTRVLFALEDEMKPVAVIMWYRLIEWIGDLADFAEKVGDRLRLLIAR